MKTIHKMGKTPCRTMSMVRLFVLFKMKSIQISDSIDNIKWNRTFFKLMLLMTIEHGKYLVQQDIK